VFGIGKTRVPNMYDITTYVNRVLKGRLRSLFTYERPFTTTIWSSNKYQPMV